jgi:hypothetical protein
MIQEKMVLYSLVQMDGMARNWMRESGLRFDFLVKDLITREVSSTIQARRSLVKYSFKKATSMIFSLFGLDLCC